MHREHITQEEYNARERGWERQAAEARADLDARIAKVQLLIDAAKEAMIDAGCDDDAPACLQDVFDDAFWQAKQEVA